MGDSCGRGRGGVTDCRRRATLDVMDVWGGIAIGFFLAVMGFALWGLWHQRHTYPPGTKLTGESDRRKGLRWISWWMTGGHG
jgi:hypothetical protein